jgi:hypothetical protein
MVLRVVLRVVLRMGDTTSYVIGGSVTIKGAVGAVKGSHTNGVSSRGATNEGVK